MTNLCKKKRKKNSEFGIPRFLAIQRWKRQELSLWKPLGQRPNENFPADVIISEAWLMPNSEALTISNRIFAKQRAISIDNHRREISHVVPNKLDTVGIKLDIVRHILFGYTSYNRVLLWSRSCQHTPLWWLFTSVCLLE